MPWSNRLLMINLRLSLVSLFSVLFAIGCGGTKLPSKADFDTACDRMKNGPVSKGITFAGSDPSSETSVPYLSTSERMDVAIPRGSAGNFEGFMRSAGPTDTGTFFLFSNHAFVIGSQRPPEITIAGCPELVMGYVIEVTTTKPGAKVGPNLHLISGETDHKLVYLKAP